MNFRFTKKKTIISLILGFVGLYFYSGTMHFGRGYMLPNIWQFISGLFTSFFGALIIIYSLVLSAMVYIIWSLFQRSEKP